MASSEITGLLTALKAWRKAVRQLKAQGKPDAVKARAIAAAKDEVLAYLASDAVIDEIDDLIQRSLGPDSLTADDVRVRLTRDPDPLLTTELKTVRPLSVSRTRLELLAELFLQTPDDEEPLSTGQELKGAFNQLSDRIVEGYQETKPLSRKVKKRRRRDFTLGALQTALGIGLIAGNTQLDSYVSHSSYILGGNALLDACKKLIGEVDSVSSNL